MRTWLFALVLMASVGSTLAADSVMLAPLAVPRRNPIALLRPDGKIYVIGAAQDDIAGASMELYDPRLGSTPLASPLWPVSLGHDYGALFDDGRILICEPLRCQLYLPDKDSWQRPDLQVNSTPFISLERGHFLLAGGTAGLSTNPISVVLNTASLTVTNVGPMNTGREVCLLARMDDGRVFAAGGLTIAVILFTELRSSEIFDPARGIWTPTAPLVKLRGVMNGVSLPGGKALAANSLGAEIYDAASNQWTLIPNLSAPTGSVITALPNGTALVSGGGMGGTPQSATTIFDPATMSVRPGPPMLAPRSSHAIVVLQNGDVLAIGGQTSSGVATSAVERLITGEPRLERTLDAGFYVAAVEQESASHDGVWSLDVETEGPIYGGIDVGGLLPGNGAAVAFAALDLPDAETVAGSVVLAPLPGTTGPAQATLRILDSNRAPVGGPFSGVGNLMFSQTLVPGFYIFELRTGDRSPPAASHMQIFALRSAGGVGGASLQAAAGVVGYVGFCLGSRQNVRIAVHNENTFSNQWGAGAVSLTLYDAAGKVVQDR